MGTGGLKNCGEILFEVSSERTRVYKQFTSNLHGEIVNFFYLYRTRAKDPLPPSIFTL